MWDSLDECAALNGLDWADKKHDLCIKLKQSNLLEFSQVKHSPQAIDDWARASQQRFCGAPVAVCLEQRKGPVIIVTLTLIGLYYKIVAPLQYRGERPLILERVLFGRFF